MNGQPSRDSVADPLRLEQIARKKAKVQNRNLAQRLSRAKHGRMSGKRLDARRSGRATQPELHVGEIGEILLGIDGTVRGHEVDVPPGPLQRVRGIERRGAAHGEQPVDNADDQFKDAGKVAQGAR